jgi:plastocyanin
MRSAGVRRFALVCVLLGVVTACGGSPSQTTPTASAPPSTTTPAAVTAVPTAAATATPAIVLIELGDHFFDPAQLTVKVGTTVTWKSVGQSTHDLAARDGSFALGAMSFGQTFSFTFNRAGRFPYVCMQHEGDGMGGEVTVVD